MSEPEVIPTEVEPAPQPIALPKDLQAFLDSIPAFLSADNCAAYGESLCKIYPDHRAAIMERTGA